MDVCSLLISNGGDLTLTDSKGWTVLHIAASEGHLPVVGLLLANGVGVEAVNVEGKPAIYYAK